MTTPSSKDETTPLGSDRRLIEEARREARGPSPKAPLPTSFGPYRIIDVLGEGGMGVVYLAEQTKPIRRRVALKLVKPGMDSRQVLARFETEREALALMNHANVARVYDAGATEQGLPYFAMEYVPGIPITEYCDKHRLTNKERLLLFMDVCHAIQHAHQKGIIHRDVKPSNVLVSVQDDKAVVKVIDFGVAKATQQRLTEQTLFTEQGQLIGTPGYMSPEQAEMTALDIDTRTDIYSLGVLLYELLAGALPFDTQSLLHAGLAEMQRIIREVDPPKPSTKFSGLGDVSTAIAQRRHTEPKTLSRQLRGDLDWIVMKCLEKDRTRRYETANGLALEIQRYLNSEPVLAGPPGAGYRLRRFIHRNRKMVAAVVAVVVVLLCGMVGTGLTARWALRERKAALMALDAEAEQRQIVEQRGRELKQLSSFHASLLRRINVEAMGRGLREDIESEAQTSIRNNMQNGETPDPQFVSFTQILQNINMSNIAVQSIDRHILSPATDAINASFEKQPLVRAELLQAVAVTYQDLGIYEPASTVAKQAFDLYRQEAGADDPRTLLAMGDLGILLNWQGEAGTAEPILRESLERRRNTLGPDHPETLCAMHNLASLLKDAGSFDEAERLLSDALERRTRVLGEDHPATISIMQNKALLLQELGRLTEAETLLRDVCRRNRRLRGDRHSITLASINNLGVVLDFQGKIAEAEVCYRESLEGQRRVLGDDHPETLSSLNNLGAILFMQGKFEAAEISFREALSKRQEVLGEDHASTIQSMSNLGAVLATQGKRADAEPYFRGTLERFRRKLGDTHPDTLTAAENVGTLLLDQGKDVEAAPFCREAWEGRRRVLGEQHRDTIVALGKMARLHSMQGRKEEAANLYQNAVQQARQHMKNTDPDTALLMIGHGVVLMDLGRFEEAEEVLRSAVDLTQGRQEIDPAIARSAHSEITRLYETWDAAEPGKGYAEKAAQWREAMGALPASPTETAPQESP